MKPKPLTLTIMDGGFAIHRLLPDASLPKSVLKSDFFVVARTEDELSVVVSDRIPVESPRSEGGWAGLKVEGPLDFAQVGILAGISAALAAAGIPLFAVSTFDTDYVLVKQDRLAQARKALTAAGYRVRKQPAAKNRADSDDSSVLESATTILEKHLPQIRILLVEKAGKSALSAVQSDAAIAMALGSTYEFLPAAVRLLVRREAFIQFGLANRDRLYPKRAQEGIPSARPVKTATQKGKHGKSKE